MRTVIEECPEYTIFHHIGIEKFRGCQCYRDCTCHEDFVPFPYNYWSVQKRINKVKTTRHNSLEEAIERAKFILTLPKNRIIERIK